MRRAATASLSSGARASVEYRHHLRQQPAGQGPGRARVRHATGSTRQGTGLAAISSIEAANAWLPGFITAYNARFGREPANAKDLHRPLTAADDLDEILAWRETRT